MEPMPSEEYHCDVPGVRVVRLDWSDTTQAADALWREWFDVSNALDREALGEDANTWDADEARAAAPESAIDMRRYAALQGDRFVGVSWFYRRPVDEPHAAGLVVNVVPGERGRGIGRALHDAMVMDALESGCTETYLETLTKVEGDDSARNDAVARAAGYRPYQVSVCSVLPIPLPPAFDAARAKVEAAGTPGYTVETSVGVPPRGWLADLAVLKARMSTDAPPGDRPVNPETWDADRAGEHYAWYDEQGKTIVVGVAREEATRRIVGFTETSWTPAMGHFVHQGDTLVHADHRGHGLGLAMKVAAISTIVPLAPGARLQRTTNAEENVWMMRVNEELGYVRNFTARSWDRQV